MGVVEEMDDRRGEIAMRLGSRGRGPAPRNEDHGAIYGLDDAPLAMRPTRFADASGGGGSEERVVRALVTSTSTHRGARWASGDNKPRPDSYLSLAHTSRGVRLEVAPRVRWRRAARRVPLAARDVLLPMWEGWKGSLALATAYGGKCCRQASPRPRRASSANHRGQRARQDDAVGGVRSAN